MLEDYRLRLSLTLMILRWKSKTVQVTKYTFIKQIRLRAVHVTSTAMSTSLFIKVMHIVSASGHKGPLVCVIASPLVPKDKFYVEKIVGLCNTSNLDADGWIYIANERAGTPAMWKHFFLNAFIPFIVNVLKDILLR